MIGYLPIFTNLGILKVEFEYFIVVPTIDKAIGLKELNLLATIVSNGRTELDIKNWLRLLCSDIYCTTTQVFHRR